jgi:hypothetical protein
MPRTVLYTLTNLMLLLFVCASAALAQGDRRTSGEPPEVVGVYLSLGQWDLPRVDAQMAELAASGVNFVIDYALRAPTPGNDAEYAAFKHYLDAAQSNGIGVAFYLGEDMKGISPFSWGKGFKDVEARVRQLIDEPAIVAWYIHDENLPGVTKGDNSDHYVVALNQMERLYQLIRKVDPDRAQLSVWSYIPTYEEMQVHLGEERYRYGHPDWLDSETEYKAAMERMFRGTTDIVMVDPYPIGSPWKNGELAPGEAVKYLVRRAQEYTAPNQKVYLVFQAFSWKQYQPSLAPGAQFPTRSQMREMLSAAADLGCRGAIAYSWFDLATPLPERKVEGNEQALAELKQVLIELSNRGWPDV